MCLVDDHPLFREGLRMALAASGTIEVVGEAETGHEALSVVAAVRTGLDVILLDLRLPDGSGIDVARAIRDQSRDLASMPRIIVISATAEDEHVVEVLRLGARGYLMKGTSRDELLRAIRVVADGGAVFSPPIAQRLPEYFSRIQEIPGLVAFPELTEREREILELIARGLGNRQISRELFITEKTVRNHITHLFMKLRVSSRAEAGSRARDAGLGAGGKS